MNRAIRPVMFHFMYAQPGRSPSWAGDARKSQMNNHEQPRTNKADADNRLELSDVLAESCAAGV